ncbi:MAG: cupin domain-containing protein [Candidatus Hydrothermota bacterium]|nr:MAG: cupin domain-containing protein [Candidatus Hydrothermae bacterium]
MLIKKVDLCEEFIAGDGSLLREVLHPKNDKIALPFSLAYARVKPKEATIPHRLKTSFEVYFILQGKGVMHVNEESENVSKGDAVVIPPNSIQWIENSGAEELVFICVVSPPWSENDEEILKNRNQGVTN